MTVQWWDFITQLTTVCKICVLKSPEKSHSALASMSQEPESAFLAHAHLYYMPSK